MLVTVAVHNAASAVNVIFGVGILGDVGSFLFAHEIIITPNRITGNKAIASFFIFASFFSIIYSIFFINQQKN